MTFSIDRRIIYLCLVLALSLPLALQYSVAPARMQAAETIYEFTEALEPEPGKVVFMALDFGPNTKAENEAQTKVAVEHLMRRRIPIVFFSLIPYSEPFLKSIPLDIAKKLAAEDSASGQSWSYGQDWINLGFKQGGSLFLQGFPKQKDLKKYLKADIYGTSLKLFSFLDDFKSFSDILALYQFTGSSLLDLYLEFFSSAEYRPPIIHGGTSVTTPESYIYLDSGQLAGLLEGIAGAAWYSKLLDQQFAERGVDEAQVINTSLGIAHLLIIALIILGNLQLFFGRMAKSENKGAKV